MAVSDPDAPSTGGPLGSYGMEPIFLNRRLTIKNSFLLFTDTTLGPCQLVWWPSALQGNTDGKANSLCKARRRIYTGSYFRGWQPVSRDKLSTSLEQPLGSLETPCLHQHMAKCAPTTGDPRVTASPWSSQLCTSRAKTALQTSSVSQLQQKLN